MRKAIIFLAIHLVLVTAAIAQTDKSVKNLDYRAFKEMSDENTKLFCTHTMRERFTELNRKLEVSPSAVCQCVEQEMAYALDGNFLINSTIALIESRTKTFNEMSQESQETLRKWMLMQLSSMELCTTKMVKQNTR